MTQPAPGLSAGSKNLTEFPPERSTSIRFIDHRNGTTTIGFRSQSTGLPTSDYDYKDPEMELYMPLLSAERPGSTFRAMMRDKKVPVHTAKRVAEGAGEAKPRAAKAPAKPKPEPMPGVDDGTKIKVVSGMTPAAVVTMTAAVVPQEEKPSTQLASRANDVTSRAAALQIKDQASYEQAVELAKGMKALADEAEAAHRPVIKKAYDAHRAATALLASIVDPINTAVRLLKGKIGAWDTEQERLRRIEEDRIRAEQARIQREQEEEYRRQQEAIRLENERLEREREEAIEAAAAKVEEQGGTAEEVEAAILQAEALAPAPQPMMMAPLPPPPPPPAAIVPSYQQAAGTSIAKTWKGEVVDLPALVKWVAANPQYVDLFEVKQGPLNRLVAISKERTNIPGVRAYADASVRLSR